MNSHPTCSIDDLATLLPLFCNAEMHPFLISPPGIGKTTQVRTFADLIKAKLIVESVALLDRLDLGGLPYTEEREGHRVTRFAPCDLIRDLCVETNPNGPKSLVYWNEMNSGHESVLPSLYRLFDERAVGGLHLRPNVFMIADGNPASSMSSGRDLPMALRRRFCWLSVTNDLKTFERWASNNGIDVRILAFLNCGDFGRFLNDFDATKRDRLTYSCPASWEKLSKILPQALKLKDGARNVAFAAIIGMEAAASLHAFLKHQEKLPKISVILSNPENAELPAKTELLSLLVAGVVNACGQEGGRFLSPALELGVRMISAPPASGSDAAQLPEYGVFLLRMLMRNDRLRPQVQRNALYPRLLAALEARPELMEAIMMFGRATAA